MPSTWLIIRYAIWNGCRISESGPYPCTILGMEAGQTLYGIFITHLFPHVLYPLIRAVRYSVKLLAIIGLIIETRADKQYLSVLVVLFLLCYVELL